MAKKKEDDPVEIVKDDPVEIVKDDPVEIVKDDPVEIVKDEDASASPTAVKESLVEKYGETPPLHILNQLAE